MKLLTRVTPHLSSDSKQTMNPHKFFSSPFVRFSFRCNPHIDALRKVQSLMAIWQSFPSNLKFRWELNASNRQIHAQFSLSMLESPIFFFFITIVASGCCRFHSLSHDISKLIDVKYLSKRMIFINKLLKPLNFHHTS